jgi:hypothetical protein
MPNTISCRAIGRLLNSCNEVIHHESNRIWTVYLAEERANVSIFKPDVSALYDPEARQSGNKLAACSFVPISNSGKQHGNPTLANNTFEGSY